MEKDKSFLVGTVILIVIVIVIVGFSFGVGYTIGRYIEQSNSISVCETFQEVEKQIDRVEMVGLYKELSPDGTLSEETYTYEEIE